MTTWRTIWWVVAGVVAGAGALGTPLAIGTRQAVSLLIALAVVGALSGWVISGEHPSLRRPIALGIGIFAAPFIVPGLVHLLGPTAWALIGTLLLTSPYVIRRIGRRLARHLLPSETERAGLASPEEALRRQWLESTKQLRRASSDRDRLSVVELRAQILDDLVDRHGAQFPHYVWTALRDSSGSDHASGGPEDAGSLPPG